MARRGYAREWERLFEQKHREFLESDCREALSVSNFDELKTALQRIAEQYQGSHFPDFVNKLEPGLKHLESFTKAISSAAQAESHAILTWGAIQAVMESACANKYAVDDMLEVVAELNETLPLLNAYEALFDRSPKLQASLQSLYDIYMDYCLASVQYIKRSGTSNFLRYFINSSPQNLLEKTKKDLIGQTKMFRTAIHDIHIGEEERRIVAIQDTLQTDPLSEVPSDAAKNDESDLDFPIITRTQSRNYIFLGRDKVLEEMHDVLRPKPASSASSAQISSKHGVSPRCCILHGLGGIGKTQIGLEYTYRYVDEYDAIFWVRANSGHSLAACFAEISQQLDQIGDLADPKGQEQTRAIRRALDWFANTKRKWLLVFDNAKDMADLNPYFPFSVKHGGNVIITTQKSDFFPLTDPACTLSKRVENLDRDDGAKILFTYLRRRPYDENEEETACCVSDLLDGLPLALATIGGYLNQTESSVVGYYDNLKKSSLAWRDASAIGPAKQYEKTLQTVFDHAFGELTEDARCLINLLAFLNPDWIPEEMFTRNIGTKLLPFAASEAQLIDLVRVLRKRELVRRDTSGNQPYLSIHRTVQWSVLMNLSENQHHRWQVFGQTFDILRTCLPATSEIDNPEPDNWQGYERYVPQLLEIRSHCLWPEPPVELPVNFAEVLSDMSTYIWQAGLMNQGVAAMHTAENILDDQHIDENHPLRGRIHEHLGIIASFCGVSERDEAIARRKKAIAARSAEFDGISENRRTLEDKIKRWNVESDMAFGHLQWEDFDACEDVLDRCLQQYKGWGTEDDIPFEYVKYNHCIAYVRMAQGRKVDAVRHAKKSAKLAEKCAGTLHPTTYLCRFTLAHMLYLADQLDEAIEEAKHVLDGRSKICGEYNHWTLEACAFLASLLAKSEDHVEAEKLYLRCIDRRKHASWNMEGVARTQYLYGQTLESLGKHQESVVYLEKAMKTKDFCLVHYAKWLPDPKEVTDDLAIFDQMVSMWAGRYTGKLVSREIYSDATSS